MSFYKQQLKRYLAEKEIAGKNILSIGNKNDDRDYFKRVECDNWLTMDSNPEFRPDLFWNMNNPVVDADGDTLHDQYLEDFDYVLALELWEYIYDPLTAHKNIYALLKPGGTYIGSYPFIYGKHNPAGSDYLRYTDDAIYKLLTVAGFSRVNVIPRVATAGYLQLLDFFSDEGMKIRTDLDHQDIGYIVEAKK